MSDKKPTLSIVGKITHKLDIISGTSGAGKEWRKQTFIIDTGAEYNPQVAFDLFGDEKIEMLENYDLGRNVEVLFNVSVREGVGPHEGKWFKSVDAWKIQSNNVSTNEIGDVAAVYSEEKAPPF